VAQLAFAFARSLLPAGPSRDENAAPDTGPTERVRKAFCSTTVRSSRSAEPHASPAGINVPARRMLIAEAAVRSNISPACVQLRPDRAVPPVFACLASSAEPSEALIGPSGLARRALIREPADRPETLAGCFDFVAHHAEVPARFRALLPAARKMIARDTRHDLADLPADPSALRLLLAATRPRRRKLSRSRWNALTILRSVLILAGWHAPEAARRYKLPDAWQNLLIAAGGYDKRRALAAFFRHCHRTGRTLHTIDSEALIAFEVFLVHSTLDPAPRETTLLARSAWAFMQAHYPRWPRQELQSPPRRPAAGAEPDRKQDEPLIGASGLAGRALIHDPATRPETLAACFDFVILHPEAPDTFRQELPTARDHIGRAIGRDLTDLPADPLALRPLIARALLHKRGAQNRRWNAATILRSVLILTGWHSPEARLRYKLPREWEVLLIAANRHGQRRALAAFMRHAHRLGLTLPDITSDTLVSYVDWLARWTLNPDPWKAALLVEAAWRKMSTRHAAWPVAQVRLPPRRSSPFATRADLRNDPLVNSDFLANRALLTDNAERPTDLGTCLDFVAGHPSVPHRFQREARGAKAALARLTGRQAADLPTDAVTLRPLLASVQPVHFKLSNKRWRNVLAVVRSTLILCGWLSAENRKRDVLSGEWGDLLSTAKEHQKHRALAPFFRFCQRLELTPVTVTKETLLAYIDWLTKSTLEPVPWQTALWVQEAWKYMQRRDATWPDTEICLPSRQVFKRRTDFIDEFYADGAGYLESLTKHHLRDPTYRHPLAPASIRIVKVSILRAATFLANAGTPIADITGIAALVKPAAFETILLAALDDAGGRWNVLAKHIADNLLLAAKRWVKPSDDILKDLEEQASCVHVGRSERRRRQLLSQFATSEDRVDLFDLPWRAFEQADLMLKQSDRLPEKGPREPAAKLHETALALALLFTEPIRIRNLVALDVANNLQRDRRGKLTRIFVDAYAVKNSIAIEIFLPEPLVARIERHLEIYRPILLRGASSTALFPGRGGMPIGTQTLGNRLRRIVERQLGARFTAHLARHLAAEYLLEKDVNNLPIAQRLLGHTQPHTTAAIYGGPRTSAAQRVYADLVEQDRIAVAAREGQRKKYSSENGRKR
jgi:integrase